MRSEAPLRLRVNGGDLLLAGLLLLLNLGWLGHVGLYDVDEAIFGEATREMVETGDFVRPTYNYESRWDKPPLMYWAMAPAVKVLGPTSRAARTASAVAGALLALLLMAFGTAVFGDAAGRVAGLVVATSLHGYLLSRWAATDITLTLLMAAGWIALFVASEHDSIGWFLVAALALALATLTKGPVALVLPGGVWLVYLLLRGGLWRTLDRTHCWWGVLLYAAVLFPWCFAIYARYGTEFFRAFLGYHNLDRFATKQSGHGGPLWYFLLIAAGGLLPWTGFVLAGLRDALDRWMDGREGRALVYSALWLLAVLALFSASKTKLPNYIAPAYPAAALLAGYAAARWAQAGPRRGGAALLGALGLCGLGAGLASVGAWLPHLAKLTHELGGRPAAPGSGPLVAGLVIVAAGLVVAAAWQVNRPQAPTATALAGAVAGVAVWLGVMPVVYHYQQGTPRIMTAVALEHLAGGELATLNVHQPSIAYYARRQFTRYSADPQEAWMRRQPRYSRVGHVWNFEHNAESVSCVARFELGN